MKVENRESQDGGNYYILTTEEYNKIKAYFLERLSKDEYQIITTWFLSPSRRLDKEYNLMDMIKLLESEKHELKK